ncbi:MAG: ATPase [Alphaproteobacteria bacterium]|nr:ATPase [Alphaproteobacteria bacterium]
MKKEWMQFKAEKPKLKRFYKQVSVAEELEGWQVLLDGRPMRTPAKALLFLPSRALAEAVAAEWAEQGEEILPDSMPMMQFSCVAVDYVAPYHDDVLAEATEYAATDVLCYRADEPAELAAQQYAAWQPLVDWAEMEYGIVMRLTTGIMPVAQEAQTLAKLSDSLKKLSSFRLAAAWLMAKHCSSLLLALAALNGRITPLEAHAISRVDENYQNTRWGEDAEARSKRESGEAEMAAIGRFLKVI